MFLFPASEVGQLLRVRVDGLVLGWLIYGRCGFGCLLRLGFPSTRFDFAWVCYWFL